MKYTLLGKCTNKTNYGITWHSTQSKLFLPQQVRQKHRIVNQWEQSTPKVNDKRSTRTDAFNGIKRIQLQCTVILRLSDVYIKTITLGIMDSSRAMVDLAVNGTQAYRFDYSPTRHEITTYYYPTHYIQSNYIFFAIS